jgi:hypothetical protein
LSPVSCVSRLATAVPLVAPALAGDHCWAAAFMLFLTRKEKGNPEGRRGERHPRDVVNLHKMPQVLILYGRWLIHPSLHGKTTA